MSGSMFRVPMPPADAGGSTTSEPGRAPDRDTAVAAGTLDPTFVEFGEGQEVVSFKKARALDGPLTLSSCSPQGCSVAPSLGADQAKASRRRVLLQPNTTAEDGRTLSHFFSLSRFSAARDRLRTSRAALSETMAPDG